VHFPWQPGHFVDCNCPLFSCTNNTDMAFRGNESPMDWEYNQGHGPIDANSPFQRFAMENKKRKIGPERWVAPTEQEKGTYTQFGSPTKHELPSFGPPNGRPFFFSDVPAVAPLASPFRAPSFTTPRKPFDVDFSSPNEASSPVNGDNEETPDAREPMQFTASPSKSTKRNSLFNLYGKFSPSPSRITRMYNDALERRIHKRRRRALDKNQLVRVRRNSEETSDSEAEVAPKRRSPSKALPLLPQEKERWKITDFFNYLSSQPDLPAVLLRYGQVIFNFVLLGFFLFVLFSFYQTIRADVDRLQDEKVSEVISEMSICSKQYIDNNCAPDKRLPALEQLCSNWELCMNRNPDAVRRAALSAEAFAQIFNSFIEPLTFKTVAVSVLIFAVCILLGNAPFVVLRRQYENHHPGQWSQQYSGVQQLGMPPTPGMGFMPQTPATGRWAEGTEDEPRRLEWNRSPSKEYGDRGRSRSPEKRG
jgi:hypothetical protein